MWYRISHRPGDAFPCSWRCIAGLIKLAGRISRILNNRCWHWTRRCNRSHSGHHRQYSWLESEIYYYYIAINVFLYAIRFRFWGVHLKCIKVPSMAHSWTSDHRIVDRVVRLPFSLTPSYAFHPHPSTASALTHLDNRFWVENLGLHRCCEWQIKTQPPMLRRRPLASKINAIEIR